MRKLMSYGELIYHITTATQHGPQMQIKIPGSKSFGRYQVYKLNFQSHFPSFIADFSICQLIFLSDYVVFNCVKDVSKTTILDSLSL